MRRSWTFGTTKVKLPQIGWKRRQEVHKRCQWQCWFCGRDFRDTQYGTPYRSDTPLMDIPTIEHLIPQCKGGTSSVENLVTACKSCNTAKRYRTIDEYREYIIRTSPEGQARDALRKFIDERGSVDRCVLKALRWIEQQIQPVVFCGERQQLD